MMFRHRTAGLLAIAALALASLDAVAVRAALPRARDTLNGRSATTLIRAARGAAHSLALAAAERAVALGGDLVLRGVEGTTRAFTVIASTAEVTSRGCAIGAGVRRVPAHSRANPVVGVGCGMPAATLRRLRAARI